jgi:hypothetical protein
MPTNRTPRTALRTTEKGPLRGRFPRISVVLYLLIHSNSPTIIPLPSSCRVECSDILDLELHVLVVSSQDDRTAARSLR